MFVNGMRWVSREALYSDDALDPWSTFIIVRKSLPWPLVLANDDPCDCLCDGCEEAYMLGTLASPLVALAGSTKLAASAMVSVL